jgi:hypothetical protein
MPRGIAVLFMFSVAAIRAQSGGYSGPTEEELRRQLPAQWNVVRAQRPETLDKSTPVQEARRMIDASDAAFNAFLRTKESVYRSQAAKLTAIAEAFLRGTGGLQVAEPNPTIDDLKKTVDAVKLAIDSLAGETDRQSLAESAALRAELHSLEALIARLREAGRLADEAQSCRRPGRDRFRDTGRDVLRPRGRKQGSRRSDRRRTRTMDRLS